MKFLEIIKSLRKEKALRLSYAIFYQQSGFYLIPCHWIVQGKCSCQKPNCSSPGKHPLSILVPNGLKNASNDLGIISSWFTQYPLANIAVVTGKGSAVSVLDFDKKNDGVELFDEFLQEFDYFKRCLKARSGGDGIHCFFAYSPQMKTATSVLPGLDFRNDGGYILVEPSSHISGGSYQWIV